MKPPRTICDACKHCKIEKKPEEKLHALQYRCSVVVHDSCIDPVTGWPMYITHEAKFLTTEKHPSCRDMNPDGECVMYEKMT